MKNDDKVQYFIVYRSLGSELLFHGWTNNPMFVDAILRNSNNSFKIDLLEFDKNAAEYEFIDYMLDVLKIDASYINYYKLKLMNTRSGNQVVTCESEFDTTLSETDCVYDIVLKLLHSIESLMVLSPYVYENLHAFLVYLKARYLVELIQDYQQGTIDVHNSIIDIIYIMMKEGYLAEVD